MWNDKSMSSFLSIYLYVEKFYKEFIREKPSFILGSLSFIKEIPLSELFIGFKYLLSIDSPKEITAGKMYAKECLD